MDNSTAVLEDSEEQNIDKELKVYGAYEQGMPLDEKKSLLLVLKDSESTALAEEHSRVNFGLQNKSIQRDIDPINNISGVKGSALECLPHEEDTFQASNKPCNIVDNLPKDFDDSDRSQSPKQKGVTYSTPKFTPKISRLSLKCSIVDDGDKNVDDLPLGNNSPKNKSQPSQDLFENNTKAELPVHAIEDPMFLKNDLPLSIRKKEDRKRNIDVFNASIDGNEQPLLINKQLKVNGKTPYYVVPHGMGIIDFTVYFKKQLAAMATNLIASQSRSLKLVPWGDPVVVSNLESNRSAFEEISGPAPADTDTENPMTQNQRYNFRGRSNKRKCSDDIYCFKLSDDDTSEDDIFIKKASTGRPKIGERTNTTPYSGSIAKRKSVFSAIAEQEVDLCDSFTSNKERFVEGEQEKDSENEDERKITSGNIRIKNICKSGILRTNETGEHSTQSRTVMEPLIDDDDEDYVVGLENNIPKRKMLKSNSKLQYAKNRKKVSKPPVPSEHIDSQDSNKCRTGTSVWLNTTHFNEEDSTVIKPLPIVNPKMRKLKRPNSAVARSKKKLTKLSSQEVDEIILPSDNEESSSPVDNDEHTPCPICKQVFNIRDIENHAAECVVYEDADNVAETDLETTTRCPVCVEDFPTGPVFEKHAKCCKKRLVRPPVTSLPHNRSKR